MGIIASLFSQIFPPQSKFNLEEIPDLTGKVIIVTGANTGVLQNHILIRTLILIESTLLSYRDWKRNSKGKSSLMPQVHDL